VVVVLIVRAILVGEIKSRNFDDRYLGFFGLGGGTRKNKMTS
jgi:hypothetical protein